MSSVFDATNPGLHALLGRAYRVDQLYHALCQEGRLPEEVHVLPGSVRARLAQEFPLALRLITSTESDGGRTTKWLLEVEGGWRIETVLMRYRDRATVCISSQAGCAMGCGFCATGQGGFGRHLHAYEMIEQVFIARRALRPGRLTNVVFMGMGEPLANLGATRQTLDFLTERFGFSPRHLTVSTVGIVPGIRRLADDRRPLTLAISLHAANDTDRSALVPINRRYPIATVLQAARYWREMTSRRVSFEWALISGVNDTERAAEELALLARPLRAHVNLIPLNPTPGFSVLGSPPEQVKWFADRLRAKGVAVSVRATRGQEIDAACGQLAMRVTGRTKPGLALGTRRSA